MVRRLIGPLFTQECHKDLYWDHYCLIFINGLFYFVDPSVITNYGDDTTLYEVVKILGEVLLKLENKTHILDIANKHLYTAKCW